MRKVIVLVAAAAVAASFVPGHAATRSATYIANGLEPIGVNTSDTSPLTIFPSDGKVPRSVRVNDVNGSDIAIDVCQNKNDDEVNCGDGDAVHSFCVPASLNAVNLPAAAGFTANHDTVVYVNVSGETVVGPVVCNGIGTVGTIDLTTS